MRPLLILGGFVALITFVATTGGRTVAAQTLPATRSVRTTSVRPVRPSLGVTTKKASSSRAELAPSMMRIPPDDIKSLTAVRSVDSMP